MTTTLGGASRWRSAGPSLALDWPGSDLQRANDEREPEKDWRVAR